MPSPTSSASAAARGSAGAGDTLRNSCHDFARSLARLPASIMDGLSRSMARRSRRPRDTQPHPPLPPPVLPEELFFAEFERRYGGRHPFFYGCRLAEALGIARREGRLVFVYLHDAGGGGNPYADQFCTGTLCSDVVVEFLDANFVSWGAVAGRGEGAAMVAALRPGSFPFCAVVSPVSDESIVEGPVSPSELVDILQRTIDEQRASSRQSWPDEQLAAAVRASRADEEERMRSVALRLRQEQDAAYLESLRKDQEKERSRKSVQEGSAKPKASNGLRPRYPGQSARELNKAAQARAPAQNQNGTVASHRAEANTKIMIRFPNGERRQQAFHHTDTIREIYRYVDSLGIPGIGNYQLVRSYPRKTYGRQQLEMSLQDAGFYPSVTLYIEQLQ
uniref:UBX domain-containing protein n=1 Tax=Oryza nivara TaxID=4536 RepID=A0A0E0ILD8_ORYNI